MGSKYVTLQIEGSVATLLLNRPPLNLMHIELLEEMNDTLLELRGNSSVNVLLIRGSSRAFSAGVDLNDFTRDRVARLMHVFHRLFETIRLLDLVAVAAVEGVALGGGFELAVGCNLIVAAESARFAFPEIKLGIFPPVASVILPRIVPRRKAMEWILLGDQISADELAHYGMVNFVWPDDTFAQQLDILLGKLTARSRPVLQFAKRAQVESYYTAYEEAFLKVENLYLRELMSLEDPHEGVKAFLEKRTPKWRNA